MKSVVQSALINQIRILTSHLIKKTAADDDCPIGNFVQKNKIITIQK